MIRTHKTFRIWNIEDARVLEFENPVAVYQPMSGKIVAFQNWQYVLCTEDGEVIMVLLE